jgi:hypothetical protein
MSFSTSAAGAPSSSTPPRPPAIPARSSPLPRSPAHQPSSESGTLRSDPTATLHSNRHPHPCTCVVNHQAMVAIHLILHACLRSWHARGCTSWRLSAPRQVRRPLRRLRRARLHIPRPRLRAARSRGLRAEGVQQNNGEVRGLLERAA